MIDCPNGEMRDRLPDLLHERLPLAVRAVVEAHVASCAACRDELALLTAMRGSLRRAPAVDVDAIVRALPRAAAPARRVRTGWLAAAAIAAVAIGGTSLVVVRHEQAVRPAAEVVASRTVVLPAPMVPGAPVTPAVAATDSIPAPARTPTTERVAQAAPRRELAVAGALSDLSDRELAALLRDIESLDALPPVTSDVESTSLAPAVAPRRGAS